MFRRLMDLFCDSMICFFRVIGEAVLEVFDTFRWANHRKAMVADEWIQWFEEALPLKRCVNHSCSLVMDRLGRIYIYIYSHVTISFSRCLEFDFSEPQVSATEEDFRAPGSFLFSSAQ